MVCTKCRFSDGSTLVQLPKAGYWIGVIVVFLLAIYVRASGIGDYGLRLDETFHFQTAIGYLKSGQFRMWEFVTGELGEPYHRAFLYSWQVALAFDWFGSQLVYGRLVSLVWGLLLFVPVLWIGFKLRLSYYWSLWLALVLALSPYAITISRWLRLYAMFDVLFLSLIPVLFWVAYSASGSNRLLSGVLAIGLMVPAVETHLMTLTLVLSLLGFLWGERFRGNEPVNSRRELMVFTAILTVLTIGGVVYFQDKIIQEINSGIRISWNYPVLLYRDLFGYGLGALVGLVTLSVTRRTPFERYLWWVIGVPLVILMLGTERLIQFRYAGHLVLLVLPLFALAAQRLTDQLLNEKQFLAAILLGLLVLSSPLADLDRRLGYIRDGNFGYVHFLGQKSPNYRPMVEDLKPLLNDGHYVLTVYFYDYYRAKLATTGAEVDNVGGSFNERIFRKLHSSGKKHQWILLPLHARNDLSDRTFRRIKGTFRSLVPVSRYNVYVFYRRRSSLPQ